MKTANINKFIKKETYSLRLDPVKFKKLKAYLRKKGIRASDYFDECLNQTLKEIK